MMVEIQVKVKKLPHALPGLPFYATPGAAGLDLPACLSTPLTLAPGERQTVPTGIAIQLPHAGVVGLVFPRSGLAARFGVNLANSVGVIDSDYTGEILCVLINHGSQPMTDNPWRPHRPDSFHACLPCSA
jgi:dUTP pyrophosphatase